MSRRLYLGNTGGGGLRISKPGYDVITEAYGSRNIAFDSRLSYLGNVIASGLIQCGGGAVAFGPLNYVPLVQIKLWDGTDLKLTDFANKNPDPGTSWSILNGGYLHAFIPAVGIVTTSTLSVVQYTNLLHHDFILQCEWFVLLLHCLCDRIADDRSHSSWCERIV